MLSWFFTFVEIILVGFIVLNATFKKYFSYIVEVSFIGGGNLSTRRKPLADMKKKPKT